MRTILIKLHHDLVLHFLQALSSNSPSREAPLPVTIFRSPLAVSLLTATAKDATQRPESFEAHPFSLNCPGSFIGKACFGQGKAHRITKQASFFDRPDAKSSGSKRSIRVKIN
jgi:hypothetical protein